MTDKEGLENDAHFNSLLPEIEWNRRGFIMSSLASGFALAVQPVSADTITTDTNGLTAGEVKIPVKDGEIPGYRAMPATGGPFATVLVVQEIFGVHEHIKDVCRRWAHLGYFAIAPDLYARLGDASKETDIAKIMSDFAGKTPDSQVAGDLDATLAFAKASGSADVDRGAIGGFCWGGRQTWLYAAHNPLLKAAVAWYGPLGPATDPTLRPKNPPDIVAELKVPVLGLYGGLDK